MTTYADHFSTRATPQSQPIPGKAMEKNAAGGFAFKTDDWKRLDRFLILGCEGGTFYAGERELAIENAECVVRCLGADGIRTVDRIVEISVDGRAPKNDPAIFALAIAAGMGTPAVRAHALRRMPEVCRIGTFLFQFIESVKGFRGWGPGLCKAVARWYDRDDVAYQVIKYQQRNGLSHRDVLRLCHRPDGSALMDWIVGAVPGAARIVKGSAVSKRKDREYPAHVSELPRIVQAFEDAKVAGDADVICQLIRTRGLPRECVPTKWLNEVGVWDSLLENMPPHALIRNLGKMTSIGLLAPMSNALGRAVATLTNIELLRKSRVHPVAILGAMLTYARGHGEKGKLTWSPVPQILDALDGAFYKAFGNVPSTGKRWLLGCDVSGSMDSGEIAGMPGLTPRVATGALALVTAAVEPQHLIAGFTSGAPGEFIYNRGACRWQGHVAGFKVLALSARQRLEDVCAAMKALPMGGTDCALPMMYAIHHKMPIDAFVVLTDNETWAGNIHPCQALDQYRQKMGIGAKLIVVAMTATGSTIADMTDPDCLEVVGFDTAAPDAMAAFVGSVSNPGL